MQTPRLLSAAVIVTLGASAFSLRADDTPAQAAARAALMQDMNGTDNTETTNPPPMAPMTPPPAIPATPPPPAEPVTATPPPPPMNMETNMQVATPAPAATVPATAPASSTGLVVPPVEQEVVPTNQVTQYPVNPAPANPPMVQTNMPPLNPVVTPNPAPDQPVTAPPVPISESQQQQLQALLQQYIANQITPAQYQAERAKILAGQ
jgi:hypothetical protein